MTNQKQDANEALSTTRNSALSHMASRFKVEPMKLLGTLKATVFKNATNEELLALVVVANEYNLNPLTQEIYAFPNSQGGGITPVVSVDGWINILNRHPNFDGLEFEYAEEAGRPVSCTAVIHSKDRTHPVRVTEYFAECARKTGPWTQYPRRMLRHKALIQGARIAFGFSGIYDEEDARDISEGLRNVTPPSPAFDATLPVAIEEAEKVAEKETGPALFTPEEHPQEDERIDDLIYETEEEQPQR